jgi:hypothetical protein
MAALPAIDSYATLFHDSCLNSQGETHSVLDRLATCIVDNDSGFEFEPFLNRLLDPSAHATPALQLILSCMHYLRCGLISRMLICFLATECGQLFSNWLLSCFPLHPKDLSFYLSSATFRILTKLSPYLLLECSFDRDILDKLRICHLRVFNAPHALKALSEAVSSNISQRHIVESEIDLELEYPIFRKSQRQRKGAKGFAKSFNPQAEKALAVFKFGIPSNSQEAESQITAILKDQQDILKVSNIFYGLYQMLIPFIFQVLP